MQLQRKKFCFEGAMCAICSPFAGELPEELRHQGQTSAPSLKGTAHNWHCCRRAPVLQPTQALGGLSLQGLKDYTGQLWGSVTVTETSLGCQLSPLCPCSPTPSTQQRPSLPLISVLEMEEFFLRKLYVLVLSPWLKNWSRSLNMTLFRVGKQQGSTHFALLTLPR